MSAVSPDGLAAIMGLKPVKTDKRGPMYLKSDVDGTILRTICAEQYFYMRVPIMTADAQKAIDATETAMKKFSETIDRFFEIETKVITSSKRASGALKDASERLGQGIARVEKAADFDRLERYVGLLERAETAMRGLAELEASGRLEKIADAIR